MQISLCWWAYKCQLICSLTTYADARDYKERKEFMKKCIVQMMSPYSGSVRKLSADQFTLVKASLIKWNGEKFKLIPKKNI